MRYWYDTEFLERGNEYPIIPISIGVVREDGREFYAEYQTEELNLVIKRGMLPDWHRENLLPHLVHFNGRCDCFTDERGVRYQGRACPAMHPSVVAGKLKLFAEHDKPEFWGYYADYDHVVLCQTFGSMIDLPKGWPMYTLDLKQYAKFLDAPDELRPRDPKDEHNALADARWNKAYWEALREYDLQGD